MVLLSTEKRMREEKLRQEHISSALGILSLRSDSQVECATRKSDRRLQRVVGRSGPQVLMWGLSALSYSCLENPHGQKSLVGYRLWDCKESDTTKQQGRAHSMYQHWGPFGDTWSAGWVFLYPITWVFTLEQEFLGLNLILPLLNYVILTGYLTTLKMCPHL